MDKEIVVYREFCISLENHIKIPLNKAITKKPPTTFPKSGAPMKQTFISEHYLIYLSGSPVKKTSHKVPFIESLAEKYPVPSALLHPSFKVPSIRAPTHIPG